MTTIAANRSFLRRADQSGIPLLLVRLVLGGLFVYMGAMKVADPVDFLRLIRAYGMAPEAPPYLLNSIAIVLPWLEVVCGIALLLGLWVRGAAALIVIMLLLFTPVVLIRALQIYSAEGTPFFKIAFDCGCGTGVEIIWIKLFKNTGLLLLGVLALLSRSSRFGLTALIDRYRPGARRQRRGRLDEGPREVAPAGVGTPDAV